MRVKLSSCAHLEDVLGGREPVEAQLLLLHDLVRLEHLPRYTRDIGEM